MKTQFIHTVVHITSRGQIPSPILHLTLSFPGVLHLVVLGFRNPWKRRIHKTMNARRHRFAYAHVCFYWAQQPPLGFVPRERIFCPPPLPPGAIWWPRHKKNQSEQDSKSASWRTSQQTSKIASKPASQKAEHFISRLFCNRTFAQNIYEATGAKRLRV